ncbi:MAG: hypothetical protein ACRD2W_02845 [Acidimicrobiales bacterium]
MSNSNGRATAITVFTPIRPRLAPFNRLSFAIARQIVNPITSKVRRLSFIHFAWWAVVRRIPFNGPPQEPETLHSPYMVFESNFNGEWPDYIDTFGLEIPIRMWSVWGTSFGYPGARPTSDFIRYVGVNQFPVDHFYASYPDATTKTVRAAVRLRERVAAFQRETAHVTPEQFQAAYRRLVRDSQRDL